MQTHCPGPPPVRVVLQRRNRGDDTLACSKERACRRGFCLGKEAAETHPHKVEQRAKLDRRPLEQGPRQHKGAIQVASKPRCDDEGVALMRRARMVGHAAHRARARELVLDGGVACHVLEGSFRQLVGQRAHAWRAARAPSAHQRALDEVVDARLRAKAVRTGARIAESMVLARFGGTHPSDAPVEVIVRLSPREEVVHEHKVIPGHASPEKAEYICHTGLAQEHVGVEHKHGVVACEQGLSVLEAVTDRASARARPRKAAVVPAYNGTGVVVAHALASHVPRRLARQATRAYLADYAQVNVGSARACGPSRNDLCVLVIGDEERGHHDGRR
eukprot:scaffold73744_cov69-Phaeocystis_antarctica.AAC.1